MARPIEVDRERALTAAMLLFWQRGYYRTSVRDLTAATGLQPGSLYGAFDSKRGLFLSALDHYSDELRRSVDTLLCGDEPPVVRIRAFFERLVAHAGHDRALRGCLLVNTLLETPPDDLDINERAARGLGYVESSLCAALQQAQQRGELARTQRPAALARLLLTGILGLRVYLRLRPRRADLLGIVDSLLSVLPAR